MTERPRLLFHVQHLLGVGHRARAHRLAEAARDAGFDVTLTAAPGEPVPEGVAALRLPAVRAADARFSTLVGADGRPADEALWRARTDALAAAVASRPPDALLVEGYPFARRKFEAEIEPLIAAVRAAGGRVACSIRDILVAKPDRARNDRIAAKAAALYDRILVHGDPAFAALSESFPAADALPAARLVYTGYVAPPPVAEAPAGETVIVSAGGGAVGEGLMTAALDARAAGLLADHRWRLLGGPNLDSDARGRLAARTAALEDVSIEPALDGAAFRAALSGAALSISQAGYNTAVDLWRAGPRAVLVPFAGPDGRESEQPLRAAKIAAQGRAAVCAEAALDGPALTCAVETVMSRPRPGPARAPDLNGASAGAAALAALVRETGLG
ncbi:MAG: glycosyltransferase [Marivibrio sp.]|uniref:glycosyltransferase family protein n=1 Tax=Marivibrio sp. TaxID=2039719 RepID=UPI0032EFE52C